MLILLSDQRETFANAQTGNIVLLGVHLAQGEYSRAARYVIPIAAFAVGVIIAESIKQRFKTQGNTAFSLAADSDFDRSDFAGGGCFPSAVHEYVGQCDGFFYLLFASADFSKNSPDYLCYYDVYGKSAQWHRGDLSVFSDWGCSDAPKRAWISRGRSGIFDRSGSWNGGSFLVEREGGFCELSALDTGVSGDVFSRRRE